MELMNQAAMVVGYGVLLLVAFYITFKIIPTLFAMFVQWAWRQKQMEWEPGEAGPQCFCGQETYVMVDGKAFLICFLHTKGESAIFPLPKKRPEHWPHMIDQEMQKLVEEGMKEHEEEDE